MRDYSEVIMKKFLVLILLILVIILSGCSSVSNLRNFTLPDDLEFLELVESLDTPEKICKYMEENFTYKAHCFYTPDPYTLWKIKEGDCNDMSCFFSYITHHHGYETWQIKIKYEGDIFFSHCIAVCKEEKLSYSDLDYYEYGFDSFKEVVERICFYRNTNYTKYIVYDYEMNIVEEGK